VLVKTNFLIDDSIKRLCYLSWYEKKHIKQREIIGVKNVDQIKLFVGVRLGKKE